MVWNVKLSVTRGPRDNYKINVLIPKRTQKVQGHNSDYEVTRGEQRGGVMVQCIRRLEIEAEHARGVWRVMGHDSIPPLGLNP